MGNSPTISVIIPVYNPGKFLSKCLDSIIGQSYKELEIICVDDASTDNSRAILAEYALHDSRIRVLKHSENKGTFLTRLEGVRAASGEYIAFIDSDDYVSVDWFRVLVKEACDSSSDIVIGEWCYDHEDRDPTYINLDPFRIKDWCLEKDEVLTAFMKQELRCFSWWLMTNKIYTRKLWELVLPKLEHFSSTHGKMQMWEDVALSSALWAYASKVSNVHNVTYHYFKHRNSLTGECRNPENAAKYIEDAAAAVDFLRKVLLDVGRFDEFSENYSNWKAHAASMVYHDFASISKGAQYTRSIRNAFDYHDAFVDNDSFFFSLKTSIKEDDTWSLEQVKRSILSPEVNVVSFDVFDTLVQRPFFEPTDLFDLLSDEFNKDTSSWIDYKQLRIDAQHSCRDKQARLNSSVEEITLDQIYDELISTTVIPREKLSRLKEREKELEIRFCTARALGKELFELARYSGKRIIICSDMYLPRETIEKILGKCGYSGYEKLFISSELGLTKSTGHMYTRVQKMLSVNDPKSILHIGDNHISDIRRAHARG